MVSGEEFKNDYVTGASNASTKLVDRYTRKTGKLDAAKSDAAQKNFEAAMKDPAVLKRRQTRLAKLTEDDLNRAMIEKGGSAYAAGVQTAGDKWATNVTPYLQKQEEIKRSLPARSRDPVQNVTQRVVPFAKGLNDLKKQRG